MQTIITPPTVNRSLDPAEIRRRLGDCRSLTATGQQEAAAIVLWSAFEAAVRLSLTNLGQETNEPIKVSENRHGLIAQAVAYGVIDPEDRDALLRFLPLCDAAAHGYAKSNDVGLLQEVSRFTERTLDEMGQRKDR